MRIFKTLRTHRPTFLADGSIDLYAPTEWRKMTQRQLRYVLTLLAMFDNLTVVKTYMLVRLSGIHVEGDTMRVTRAQPKSFSCWFRPAWWKPRKWFTLEPWQVESLIRQFDFIDQFDSMDVRLERIHGCRAVDDILDHYPFGDYLMAEQYYQLAVSSGKTEMIEQPGLFPLCAAQRQTSKATVSLTRRTDGYAALVCPCQNAFRRTMAVLLPEGGCRY